jgi:hypothetical protein
MPISHHRFHHPHPPHRPHHQQHQQQHQQQQQHRAVASPMRRMKRQAILSQALYTAITSAGYIPVCDALIAFDDQLSTYIRTSHLMTKDGGVRGLVCRLAESCGDHVDIWKWCLNHGLFTVHDLEQTELYDYRLRMLSRCAAHRKAKVLQWLLLDPTGPKLFISLSSQLPASPLLIVSFF